MRIQNWQTTPVIQRGVTCPSPGLQIRISYQRPECFPLLLFKWNVKEFNPQLSTLMKGRAGKNTPKQWLITPHPKSSINRKRWMGTSHLIPTTWTRSLPTAAQLLGWEVSELLEGDSFIFLKVYLGTWHRAGLQYTFVK